MNTLELGMYVNGVLNDLMNKGLFPVFNYEHKILPNAKGSPVFEDSYTEALYNGC